MFNRIKVVSSSSILFSVAAAMAVAACGSAPEAGTTDTVDIGTTSDALRTPALPSPTLAVPAGNRAAFAFDAIGVQIYACSKTATGFGWVFKAPEATLYKQQNGNPTGTHYAGPTWEFKDGSKVVGTKVAAFTADPSAIPELLLKAVSHDGDGRMSGVTYIQRLDTVGGLAPGGGCDASQENAVARVDYTATYFFYEASDGDD